MVNKKQKPDKPVIKKEPVKETPLTGETLQKILEAHLDRVKRIKITVYEER